MTTQDRSYEVVTTIGFDPSKMIGRLLIDPDRVDLVKRLLVEEGMVFAPGWTTDRETAEVTLLEVSLVADLAKPADDRSEAK